MIIRDTISSLQNPRVKQFNQLQKSKYRKNNKVFVVEGVLEIERAISSSYALQTIYVCFDIISREDFETFYSVNNLTADVYEVTVKVYSKIAYRESTGGMVALVSPKEHSLAQLNTQNRPLFLVLESVEKPGNLGAILRTADAAGIDGVIVCDPLTDLYNPNVIRSSVGCVFNTPVAICSSEEAIDWLKQNEIGIYCTYLGASVPYQTIDFTLSSAIVMGTEHDGLSQTWVQAASQNIIIPMAGIADSLNVSTSAAIVCFEAKRQRGF